jgi:hypothetical protein
MKSFSADILDDLGAGLVPVEAAQGRDLKDFGGKFPDGVFIQRQLAKGRDGHPQYAGNTVGFEQHVSIKILSSFPS